MPKDGSDAVGAQVFPSKNAFRPICRMAGMPEITRYTLINSTNATEITPQIRKIAFMLRSNIVFPCKLLLLSRKKRLPGQALFSCCRSLVPVYATGTAPAARMSSAASAEVA